MSDNWQICEPTFFYLGSRLGKNAVESVRQSLWMWKRMNKPCPRSKETRRKCGAVVTHSGGQITWLVGRVGDMGGGDIFCNLWATDNKPIVWPIPLLVTATSQSGKEQFGVMGRGEGRPSPASMGDRQCGCQLGRGQQSDKKLGNKSCRPSSITAPTFLGSSCSKALSISGRGRKEVCHKPQLWFSLKIQIPMSVPLF